VTPGWLVVLGASGHGREVASAAAAVAASGAAPGRVDGFLDDSPDLAGQTIGELTVLGTTDALAGRSARALLGVGYPETKARMVQRASGHGVEWPTLVHPAASIGDRVVLGRGCFVQSGSVLTCDIRVGEFVTVNCGVTINHDVTIASLATLSPGAHLGGRVSVGEGAFIGIGASVKQGVTVGAWSVVGAGAAVVEDVPENAVVAGVPARVMKTRDAGWHLE
jgi:sugar O-acyltransferase (sialic acid O-acetyltransferase NeuD family)